MPHILIEHGGDALADSEHVEPFLDAMVAIAAKANAITPANVKMRALRHDHVRVAGKVAPFIHVTVSLMSGPSEDDLNQLADLLFDGASTMCPNVEQVTVDIRAMNPVTYRKRARSPADEAAQ